MQSTVISKAPPLAGDDSVDILIRLFDSLFADSENTVLVRGDSEPVYLPVDAGHACARIVFAHGFFTSALHEIAHWCVAGPERRKLVDFGYWYAPDGRSAEQQQQFEGLEIKPQALEWILARACGLRFRVSCDNLENGPWDQEAFKSNVHAEVLRRLEEGLPPRCKRLVDALLACFQPGVVLAPALFSVNDL